MKKYLVLLLALAIVFSLAFTAFAAAAPVPGNPSPKMDWKPEYAKKALTITPYSYDRGNAAGDKIPSNAHAADFPGLYFYWNDKQRDDGVLLVDPFVFTLFKEGKFTLTAKTSNCYWGHEITQNPAAFDAASGLYIFNIFKNCMYADKKGNLVKDDMKNINMVFIDGNYKSGWVNLVKKWENEEGEFEVNEQLNANVSFTGLKLGLNEIKISDFTSAVKGKTVKAGEYFNGEYFEYAYSTVDGKNVVAPGKRVIVGKVYETVYEVSLTVKPGGEHIVEFGNKELPPPPVVTTVKVIKKWELLDDVDSIEGEESPDGSMVVFGILGDVYEYGTTVEVEPGIVKVMELDIGNKWVLSDVFINGEFVFYDSEYIDGSLVGDFVEFEAEAGKHYEIVFTNIKMGEPQGDGYYMNFVSGTDFGIPVIDKAVWWLETNHLGFADWCKENNLEGTISDYWNFWVDSYGTGGRFVDEAKSVAENMISFKELTWAWTTPYTMVPETQVGGNEYRVVWEKDFDIEGDVITLASHLYFQADNAVSIFINGHHVGMSVAAWLGDNELSDSGNPALWQDLHDFDLYKVNIWPYLKVGTNTIKIIASNEPVTAMAYNPCGVLLAFEVYSKDN
ncbi:MAG: hypothetical protein FWE49_01855 [Synergistaceae bacterium]|nr:hypothetical protein [Synergistaceae bacterium]